MNVLVANNVGATNASLSYNSVAPPKVPSQISVLSKKLIKINLGKQQINIDKEQELAQPIKVVKMSNIFRKSSVDEQAQIRPNENFTPVQKLTFGRNSINLVKINQRQQNSVELSRKDVSMESKISGPVRIKRISKNNKK